VVRVVVARHGEQVAVHSRVGQGRVVAMQLPVAPPPDRYRR
jgi:signal transduction histidine kinase